MLDAYTGFYKHQQVEVYMAIENYKRYYNLNRTVMEWEISETAAGVMGWAYKSIYHVNHQQGFKDSEFDRFPIQFKSG